MKSHPLFNCLKSLSLWQSTFSGCMNSIAQSNWNIYQLIYTFISFRKAFQNIYSLIRPEGGDCLLTIFARSPYYDAYQSLSKTGKWASYLYDVNNYTCQWHYATDPVLQVQKILEECGFHDIDVKLVPKIYTYENYKIFKRKLVECALNLENHVIICFSIV